MILLYEKYLPLIVQEYIEIDYDYVIRTDDPSFDLFCMINSDILIGSKSTYSLISTFFHKGSKIYLPMWGHIATLGFKSKYDKNTNIEYFY